MFTGIMRVLHETLPCSKTFFTMQKKFFAKIEATDDGSSSREPRFYNKLATPKTVRGLSVSSLSSGSCKSSISPSPLFKKSKTLRKSVRDVIVRKTRLGSAV